ncbi:E3 ubiquitin-protein ligase MBR1-like [Olea europaea var. sylvestris]|uniref:E3 ubiquitin-protein ligase MBR1-like n=1 Tax=Olea europaea var. sylvestris TaxID=158386 RepID=UPI000C1D43F0|nr:E3 ubiquitin-protein ligase MBR1-like [Olea europaea var. sylvestris]
MSDALVGLVLIVSFLCRKRELVASHLGDFILERHYDRTVEELESLMETSIDDYLRAGQESLERFMEAKRMASKMTRLEEKNMKSRPDWDCNNLNDADLKSFINRQLHQEEAGMPEDIIIKRLKIRAHVAFTSGLNTSVFANACEEAKSCAICMENYENEDKIGSLCDCAHEFHANCMKVWLQRKNICPICNSLALVPNDYPDWVSDLGVLRAFFKRDVTRSY